MNEPIADATRGILDGHIVLSRNIAEKAHYPAIDVLQSVSRVMPDIVEKKHMEMAMDIREMMSSYNQIEDMINIGAYKAGSNPKLDRAINKHNSIDEFLKQGIDDTVRMESTIGMMEELVK